MSLVLPAGARTAIRVTLTPNCEGKSVARLGQQLSGKDQALALPKVLPSAP